MKVEWTNRDNFSIETTSPNSKAVLVIDVPEDVRDITCIYTDRYGFTQQAFYELKPLPKSKTREEEIAKDPLNEDLFYDDYIRGYNDCLKEIKE